MEYPIQISHLNKNFYSKPPWCLSAIFSLPLKKIITACDGINLTIRQGKLLGLVGPNGSGKTTLIRILATIILPDSGSASINGFDVVKKGLEARRHIGLVTGENKNFYIRLTGRQNLEFYAALYNLSKAQMKEKIKYLANVFELSEYLDNMFQENSQGVRQRFALARGLLNDAPVLLLDEPTKNLDPQMAQRVRTFIREELVKKRNKTVLMASHFLEEVSDISDEIAILDRGRLKAQGTLESLRRQAGDPSADLKEIYDFFIAT
ncbi:MAG TPA: ABC transporter ATP-binding protein [Candidatus Omnitrophota bacterium]|nr:ABC transporter ATP-binding protein [Candidatus Omnitrophota bacterium]HPD84665.1 ABC transporter ATP-binding protein [Candidatus Omnitrophota bacterium]HRZ03523.1 ABC transporter ATP-binding protein [Candidatus Omnitrophota bacterium]